MKEIFERTSVRRFTGESVPKDAVRKLLEAAMQAPSAGNQQPWEFIVVE
ncbi:MAG: nitroreductase family protein, partial [Candidatus Accumulibacter sp.]|nr:nitroreductase family protein [Accumulibacter sp.]